MYNDQDRYMYQLERPAGAAPAVPETPHKKKRSPALALVSLFLVFTLVVGGLGGLAGYYISQNGAGTEQPAGEPGPAVSQNPVIEVAQKADPSIASQAAASLDGTLSIQEIFMRGDVSTVTISTTTSSANVFGQPMSQESAGSGFILTADGYILTNHHVVEAATNITVMLYDGTEYPAEVVGGDAITDVAVLKIKASGLSPVRLGNSDNITVGDLVVAIGNPLGELANSLTVGYISAKVRYVYIDNVPRVMLQTDASVSPGNSGGPLFNTQGEVIGVVSAKTVASGVEGIGFAIPINIAVDIANELIQNGSISGRPLLGISGQDSSAIQDGKDYPKGVYVAEVTPGGSADKAGFEQGDVVTHFNGERINVFAELLIALYEQRVGNTVTITVWRGGRELTFTVTLDTERPVEQPEEPEEQQRPTFPWGR